MYANLPGLIRPLPTEVDVAGMELRRIARQHRLDLGWSVVVRGDRLVLEFGDDLWGLALPKSLADRLLALLHESGAHPPVVVLPRGASGTAVMFVQPDAGAATPVTDVLAAEFSVLRAGRITLLPPSRVLHGRVYWLSPPSTNPAELPTLGAVIALADRLGEATGPLDAMARSAS